MPGVMDALNFFHEKKIPMGICTNKRQYVTEKLLEQMNLKGFFNVIVGANNDVPLKPKPDMILLAMKQFNTKNRSFYMVGDTSNDIDAAKAANIKSIVIDGGYTHENVNTLGADYTLDSMKEITKLLYNT